MRPTRARKGWALEWWLAGLAASGAALTAAVQILTLTKAPTWLFVTLYVLTGALAIAATLVGLQKKRIEEKRAWIREVTSYLELGPGSSGRLPTVSEVSPYQLGVSRSAYASDDTRCDDPYVQRREADEMLRAALSEREPQFIILVGASKSGKSRTMYEAILHTLPDSPLIVPVSEEAIGKLFSLDPPLDLHPKPGVLWLDDLDEARLGTLTPALLDRLGSEVVVVASMTSQRRDRIISSDSEIGRVARQALDRAEKIYLEFELTDEERMEAKALYPEERFDHSIGEPLVAADQLTARFEAGRDARDDDNKPVGYALVRVAIDWRRVGLGRPIRDSELRKLYPEYLASIRAGLEPSDDLYNGGLAWACKPVASHVALLEKANVGVEHGFVAFDYLVALLDGQHAYPRRDVLPVIWDFVIESLSEEEVLPLGVTAYLRNDPTTAGRIWRNVAGGSSTYSGEVAYYLGILLKEQGDTEGAREAYQEAIDSGHPDAASKAMNNLGVLLEEQGDIEGARAAYQRAIDSGHTDRAPMAVVNLGVLLGKQGDDEGAREAFQRVIDSGHPDQAPKAIYNLGVLLHNQGNTQGARAAYQKAIDSGHPEAAPKAEDMLNDLNQ
jgi:tetratricopeptide (TPR) repeat protein